MNKRKTAIVFGTGDMCKQIMPSLKMDGIEILAFVDDTLPEGEIRQTFGRPILSLASAATLECDYIFIACRVDNFAALRDRISRFYKAPQQIISLDFEQKGPAIIAEGKARSAWRDSIKNYLRASGIEKFFDTDKIIYSAWLRRLIYNENNFKDWARRMEADLLAHEILEGGVRGCIAEFGVYKGEFAAFVRELFPDRLFYLFDTFSGFDCAQEQSDIANYQIGFEDFSDTSEEFVLKAIGPGPCVVKKGIFPASALDVDAEFCFVSIDVDLSQPIWDGLEFFWPRLAPGGYIMVHDYGYLPYGGCRKAVREFCKANGLACVPVCDWAISAILAKPLN